MTARFVGASCRDHVWHVALGTLSARIDARRMPWSGPPTSRGMWCSPARGRSSP